MIAVRYIYASTGNMRTAYEFFGIDPYSRCEQLATEIQAWADQVYTTATTRLRSATDKIAEGPDNQGRVSQE